MSPARHLKAHGRHQRRARHAIQAAAPSATARAVWWTLMLCVLFLGAGAASALS